MEVVAATDDVTMFNCEDQVTFLAYVWSDARVCESCAHMRLSTYGAPSVYYVARPWQV